MGLGNTYNKRAYVFSSQGSVEYIFAVDPQSRSTKLLSDGTYRLRTKAFAIKNVDAGGSTLLYGFDNTNFTRLGSGDGFSLNMVTDRFYVRTSDASCEFQVSASLGGT